MRTPEEIKKALRCKGFDEECATCAYDVGTCQLKSDLDAVAYMEQLEAHSWKWISVKERLPEKWEDNEGVLINYMVYMPEYGVDVGNYLPMAKTWTCMGIPCKVTHWMPLPEPPKEA